MASINQVGATAAHRHRKGQPLIFRAYAPAIGWKRRLEHPIPAEGDPVLPDTSFRRSSASIPTITAWLRGGFSTARFRDAVQAAGHRRWLRTAAHRHHLSAADTFRWTGW